MTIPYFFKEVCLMKSFIPKAYQKDQITVRLNVSAIEKIDQIASRLNLSRSELINQCVEFALENMEEEEKDA